MNKTWDIVHGALCMGHCAWDMGHRTWDMGHWTWDTGGMYLEKDLPIVALRAPDRS